MYLMYVDGSGDAGMVNSPTRYFVLSGLVLHELRWHTYLNELIEFRRGLKQKYGIKLREEFHSGAMLCKPGELVRIAKHDRLAMIREFASLVGSLRDWSIINVLVDKYGKPTNYQVFEMAWKALIQRFQNTLRYRNFPGPANADERGMLFSDNTDNARLVSLLRQMRRFNPIPNQTEFGPGARNLPLLSLVEDPNFRDSAHSYFVQAVDLAAFLLYQKHAPSSYLKKKAGHHYFDRLKPVLCKWASPRDPDGIVRI